MKLILLTFFTFALATAHATNYYFSSLSGDDNRSSAEAQNPATPWKTINKLNSIFSSLSPGDAVLFKRGETFYGSIDISHSREKLSLTASSSSAPITIGAYGSGDKPTITGWQTITNWISVGNGIYETTLNQDNLNLLTFQDILQPIGRWPKVTDPDAGYLTLTSHVGSQSITSDAIATAKDFTGGELVIRKWGWILDRGIITSQTANNISYTPLLSPAHPSYTYEPLNGFGFFFQNHVNCLTALGDWMFDKTAKKLRVYFGANNPTSYSVKAATIENLVKITSSTFINIDDISFSGANAHAINFEYAYNIQILNSNINFSGIDAIATVRDNLCQDATGKNCSLSSDVTVRNCSITNTNNNAITAYANANWMIKNNIIKNTGTIRGMGMSGDGQYIALSSPGEKSVIEFNDIRNTGYNAIEFKGDSTLIRNNFIDSFSTIKSDGGGIYNSAETGKKGRRILNNIVLNGIGDRNGRKQDEMDNPFAGNVHGIYMDGGATDVEITGNSVANCSSSGIELSSPSNTEVLNNTLYNNTYRQIYFWESKGPISNLTVKNNILFALKRNELVSYIDGSSNTTPNWGVLDSNYYCRPISEPFGIDTIGYSQPSYDDYTDGGIIQTFNYHYLSLDKWQAFSNQDAHTKKSPIPISDISNARFEYNATTSNKTVSLDTSYVDVKGTTYNTSVTLAPFSSIILMRGSKNQTLTFGPLANKTSTDAPFALTATATSGLPVSFRIISGPAKISGNIVTLVDTGIVVVQAEQMGNKYFNSAPPIRQSFSVKNCVPPTFLNNATIVLAASCANNDGNISIIPTSGVAPFMYSKDGGKTYVAGADAGSGFLNLSSGVYPLRLKDATGCESAIVNKTVNLNCACTAPTFSQAGSDASCSNNDGNITFTNLTGTAPFQFSIDGGKTYVSSSNTAYTFTNLSANTYQLRVKDAKGCESMIVEKTLILNCNTTCTPPTFLNNGTIALDASCSNNDGNISIIPTSGIPPFMYSKDGGKTYVPGADFGYTFGALAAGTYNLRLKDAKGCESAIVQKSIIIRYGVPCTGFGTLSLNSSSVSAASGNESLNNYYKESVLIYPNPSKGQFKLQFQRFAGSKIQISISNAQGIIIQNKVINLMNSNTVDFNLSNQRQGLYQVQIIHEGGMKVVKVLIQK